MDFNGIWVLEMPIIRTKIIIKVIVDSDCMEIFKWLQ